MERVASPGEHSVSSAECNLADDAPWKKIQKNTFTRWCNEHLRCTDRAIGDLQFDLNDGLTLIALLEVLSHKKITRKYHTRPSFRQMRLDNVSVALEFLEQEKIKLVSIDSKAIIDGNMKLILGLVWTLILHYSISCPFLVEGEAKKQTPELRLLGWIQDKVPELPITNFSLDWMDGKALGALVDGLAPGLCPDWESWDDVQRMDNVREAMQQADEWLGVPQVIAPEEIIDPCVDEQSIMTYLSMFPKAELKAGAPLKPKSVSKPKACRASGRGLQPKGVRLGQVADFKVDASKAGPGCLEVCVKGPNCVDVPVQQGEAAEGDYTFHYVPSAQGIHTVLITWAGEHIFKSPFEVMVGPRAGPQMIRAWGPGLQQGMVDMSADFVVESTGANVRMLGFAIEGPSEARIECDEQDDGSCNVRFWPTKTGEYAVHVMCDGEEIEDSPFMPYIKPNKKKCYPKKVKVSGMGVSQNGFILNSLMEFTVDARFAGDGSLGVQVQSLEGKLVAVDVMHKEHGLYICFYTPSTLDKHIISVTWGGINVPGSPFRVNPGRIKFEPSITTIDMMSTCSDENDEDIDLELAEIMGSNSQFKLDFNVTSPERLQTDARKVKAYGPGLETGFVGTLADFTINTNGSGSGQLSVTVDGPCPAQLKCSDNQDGTCTVTYLPTGTGEHLINILFQGSHIPGSPFPADIQLPFDPSKMVVPMSRLKMGKVGEPCAVIIGSALVGLGGWSVEAVSDSGQTAKTEVQANNDGTQTVVYIPLTAGVYTLRLKYGGNVLASIPSEVIVGPDIYKSQVKICGNAVKAADGVELNHLEEHDPASVFANGIGLLQGKTGESNHFTISTSDGGSEGISVSVEGPSDVNVSCTGGNDGVYDVWYTPSVPGLYDVNLTYRGEHIQGSPFKVPVKEVSDERSVAVSAPAIKSGVCAQTPQTFTVDCRKTGESPQSVAVMTPRGKIELVEVKDNCDWTYSFTYSPSMEGDHALVVKYTDEEAFSSPVQFKVIPTNDSTKQKVSGPQVESELGDKTPHIFTINCSKTGEAPEYVAVMTANGIEEPVNVTNNNNGTYSLTYFPSVVGSHSLVVKYADGEELHRPFDSKHSASNDVKKLKVSVPGVVSPLCAQVPQTFNIDCSQTGDPPEKVSVMTPTGKIDLNVTENRDGTYSVSYTPSVEGDHSLTVKYTNEDEYVRPYQFQVLSSESNRTVNAKVPGLESGVCPQVPQIFTLNCSETGEAPQSVAIMSPNGTVEVVQVSENEDGKYSVFFSPSEEGAHSLLVRYADEEEFSNVSNFQVLPIDNTNKLKVYGPGLDSGFCAKSPETFIIECSETKGVPGSIDVMTPNGKIEHADVTHNRDGTSREGTHSLLVKYTDEDEFCSPYQFHMLPSDSHGEVKCSVQGQESGIHAKLPMIFTINSNEVGEAPHSVAIMTPSGKLEHLKVTDNGDGTYLVAFSPYIEGAHSVMVKYNGDEDFCNLSKFQVLPVNDVDMPKASGPVGLLGSGISPEAGQTFTNDSHYLKTNIITDNENVTHSPMNCIIPSAKTLVEKYSDNNKFFSHHQVQEMLRDSTRNIRGPLAALESGASAHISQTGEAPQCVAVKTPDGKTELLEVTTNRDGTWSAAFSSSTDEPYSLMVEEKLKCHSNFEVLHINDTNEVKVTALGMESGQCAKVSQTFTIDCSKSGHVPKCVTVMTPDGRLELAEVSDNGDGTFSVAYSPYMEGPHSLLAKYTDQDEFCSPFSFHVLPTDEANKLKSPRLELGLSSTQNPDCSKTGESGATRTQNATSKLQHEVTDKENDLNIERFQSAVVNYDEEGFGSLVLTDGSKTLKVCGPGVKSGLCGKVPQTFTIDCCNTGVPDAVTIITPHGKRELVDVIDNRDGTCTVVYCPSMEGAHSMMVNYPDEGQFYSPFHFHVKSDAGKVCVSGPGLLSGLLASLPAHFSVDTFEAGEGQLSVEIVDPEGRIIKARICDNYDGTYDVSYVPNKVGSYTITIKYSGEEIPASPYHVCVIATGDPNKCIVTGPELGSIIGAGKEIGFLVNTQSAGMGKVSCFVLTPDGTEVEADVIEREDGTFEICYTANKPGKYIISAGFGGESLFSCPFQVMPEDQNLDVSHHGQAVPPKLVMTRCSYIPLKSEKQQDGLMPFDIVLLYGLSGEEIEGEIEMPLGSRAQAEVVDNNDGTVTVMYDPIEEGLHHMHINVNGTTVSERPLQFYVNNATNKDVMAHGPGLVYGLSNEIAAFTIFNKDLVQGELDIALEGPSKAEIHCLNNKNGTSTVTYLPTVPGDYNISVRCNDKDIKGSPFTAKIACTYAEAKTDVNQPRSQLRLSTKAEFSLDITEDDISLLTASIMSPSGQDVSCILKAQPENHIGISFIPKEIGEHLVSIMKNGQQVANSPISLNITPLEIGDASRVKVFGPGLAEGFVHELSTFVVDTREAGYGGLTLAIEGPSNLEVQTEELDDGTCGVSYRPTEAGIYTVSVKFKEEHVPGSPFKAVVTESGHVKVSINHYQDAATVAKVRNTCGINLKIPGVDTQHISANVCSPSGRAKEAAISIAGCDIYSVSFVPDETGVHTISTWYRGQPIPGSPYYYTVGPLGEGGPEKVQAWGLGLQGAKASVPADFSIWAREAGSGNLSVAMEGPGKADLVFEDRNNGSCGITYTVTEPGSQMDGLNSVVCPPWPSFLSDASKVSSSGKGLRQAFIGTTNYFNVDCGEAGTNILLVGMHGPTIPCEQVTIIHLGDNHYDVSYVVKEKGSYILEVKWGEEHIPGSPFHVVVA